ncbi:hypothetical protein PDJAM_G00110250 [Pangasius djambal]|uniref:Uncharacterized protein n=1 Tax=Pangasius djambal TaxID=1691987 RepID=A0ACC5Y2C5_9TELE|nr:hypothetical protein [Pangasius djambal]
MNWKIHRHQNEVTSLTAPSWRLEFVCGEHLLSCGCCSFAHLKLCEWTGVSECRDKAKHRATGLQSSRLWVQAMRFHASIH